MTDIDSVLLSKSLHCAELCQFGYDAVLDLPGVRAKCCALLSIPEADFSWFPQEALDTQAIIACTPETIYLAFPGTDSVEDILTDAIIDLVPFLGGHCHRAFYRAAKETYAAIGGELKRRVHENPNAKVVITGHSLGGALALFYAVLLKQENHEFPIESLITFGQPRGGNGRFATAVNALGIQYVRYMTPEDIVPDAPPPYDKSDWTHAGRGFLLKDGGVKPALMGREAESWPRLVSMLIRAILMWFQNERKFDDELKAALEGTVNHGMKFYLEDIRRVVAEKMETGQGTE